MSMIHLMLFLERRCEHKYTDFAVSVYEVLKKLLAHCRLGQDSVSRLTKSVYNHSWSKMHVCTS